MFQKISAFLLFGVLLGATSVGVFSLSLPASNEPIITVNRIPIAQLNGDEADETTHLILKKQTENDYFTASMEQMMEPILDSINPDWLKNAIVLDDDFYASAVPVNDIQFSQWQFAPEKFQKIILKLIAERLDFLNLEVEFAYFDDFRRAGVRVANQDNLDQFVIKQYTIGGKAESVN